MSKPKMCLLGQNMQCYGGAFLLELAGWHFPPEMMAPPLDVAIKFSATYEKWQAPEGKTTAGRCYCALSQVQISNRLSVCVLQ
jgi:hypothetical protein